MDFTKLESAKPRKLPTDPIKVFESLPSLKETPNDLWRGQADALKNWHDNRDKKDVLISLNTGAGKTIVGLLIARSLVNEECENVLYVCSSNDLVKQTSQEASRIGIKHTTRVRGSFNNNFFEEGKSFCITTYQALFNGRSHLRRYHFPEAIIFDDAHVAEGMLRQAFTIHIDSVEKSDLFNEIVQLFTPHFRELGISGKFRDSISKDRDDTAFVPPRYLQRSVEQLLQIFNSYDLAADNHLCYPFEHLKDHIDACAAIFTRGVFELSPPFLPSRALDIFERPIKRVYLSATLQSQTEFIRAFGRKPKESIIPSMDAGNGERLIIFGQKISEGLSVNFVRDLSNKNKLVIAVPNYYRAKKWSELVAPPEPENFSRALDEFRKPENENGVFVLVSRVDGIDLPHETCRLMLIDGLPSGTSLLERYQWDFLKMNNVHAARIANRLTQLFGRINRGRNDYGVFLMEGRKLNNWLSRERNIALLSPLLQKQVPLGLVIQKGLEIKTHDKIKEIITFVLQREPGWLNYYEKEIKLAELDQEQANRVKQANPVLEEAAISEAKYAAHLWNKDYSKARIEIDGSLNQTSSADSLLAGWHSVWLGGVYDLEGDTETAEKAYAVARRRLGSGIVLPRRSSRDDTSISEEQKNNLYKSLENYLGFSEIGKCQKEVDAAIAPLQDLQTCSSNQAEESIRSLGEILGFNSTRPDNDVGTGPDVLWIDEETKEALAFELKTDKQIPTQYTKENIGQGHNHIAWFEGQYSSLNLLGLVYVGPERGEVRDKTTLSDNMRFTDTAKVSAVMDEIKAVLHDLLRLVALERSAAMLSKSQDSKWKISSILLKLDDN